MKEGVWEGQCGGVQEGFLGEGGGGLGGITCPQGYALVNHRLPFPPLALPRTIPSPES